MLARQIKERLATVGRHGVGGGALMARCDKDCIAVGQHWLVKNQPLMINRQAGNMIGPLAQNIAQIGIGGVFNHDMFFRRYKQLCNQIQRILRAQCNQYLFRPRGDTASRQTACANVIDQHRIIIKAEIANHAAKITHAKRLTRAISPVCHGKQLVIHLPIDKGKGIFAPVQRFAYRPDIYAAAHQLAGPVNRGTATAGVRCFHRRQGGYRRVIADHIATAFPRLHKTGINQRLIGQHNRIARHTQLGSQHTAGRQPVTRQDRTRQNGFDHRFANLGLQAGFRAWIEIDDEMIEHGFPVYTCCHEIRA